MKKLCIFTLYDTNGASSYYRMYMFKKEFEHNFEVYWFHFWDNNYVDKFMENKEKYAILIALQYFFSCIKRIFQLIFIAPSCDIIIFQKAIIPKFKINIIRFLKRKGIKIIFDVDDAIYLNSKDNSDDIAKLCDVVVVGNEVLKQHYMPYCNNIKLLPTVDFTPIYKKYYCDTFLNKCIGWIGSQVTIDNLDLLIEPINLFIEKHPEVNFKFICNEPYGYDKKIKNSKFVKWNRETYIKEMQEFTIGVMPLKNNEFNSGKCGFKLIQYLNMKKPVVASNVGINKKIVSSNGLIANTKEEWLEAFENILYDNLKYYNCIRNIEDEFFENYHYKNIANQWLKILLY
ncbi:glycosyltransferase [Xylanivirga thermophila]|uniref:glycosyltransferase n=1 Tax=Xylanivirga thermophila TaxID=2496273 RepID=UPI00101D7149|nr:glycosyltransferase [Xylanivirga thermophila]